MGTSHAYSEGKKKLSDALWIYVRSMVKWTDYDIEIKWSNFQR